MNMPGLKNRCMGWNQMPKALQRGEAGTRGRRRYSGDRYHSGGFLLRAMPPSWHPVPAHVRHSAGGPFFFAATKIGIGRGPRCRYGHCRRAILHCSSEDAASIPNFGLEIKNQCTPEGLNRQNPASIPKSGLEIKNRCMQQGIIG